MPTQWIDINKGAGSVTTGCNGDTVPIEHSHFGSFHFVQTSVAHAQGEVHSGVVIVACIFASPSAVKGWSSMDVPTGWVQVVRGHDQSRRSGHMRSKLAVVRRRMGQRAVGVRPGVPSTRAPDPDVAQEAANERVSKLEAAIFFAAASRSKPIQDQIAETEAFISCAQKRLSVLEEERVREQELLDKALLRQERLRRELQIEREE